MIRVFSIEDHWMVTDGLKTKFRGWRDGIAIARSATGIVSALKHDDRAGFDIILLDLFLPETDPIDNIRLLKAHYPETPIVILTGEEQDIWRIQAAEAGAVAYLTKRATRSELVETIKRVYQGENLLKKYFQQTSQQQSQKEHFSSPFNIKPTEKELLNLLAGGASQKQIAAQMHLTESAVEKALHKLRKQFSASNSLELIRILEKLHFFTGIK